jgi:5-methyltetrahydropteroyltriglutamate--homocysteine methyltransferase
MILTRARLYEDAIRDTIERFEATGSPVIADSEQRKYHNFATYCVHRLPNTARMVSKPLLRRSYAPHAAVHRRPFPLLAVRRLLPGCRHTLRARAGQAVISPLSRENLSELTSDDEG